MSSYLSQEYRIQQPMSSFNVALADNVLSTLQGEYNANKAKIDQTLAVYKNQLKGLRSEDNEYIAHKINEAQSIIEQYKNKNGNLAYNSTTDTIISTITNLVNDPVIESAYTNKAKADAYEKQVQELKKKDPKLYNDLNYQYGKYKGGYQAYMEGKAKDLGNLNYIPYTDNTEEHLKKLKIIKEFKGKRFIETPYTDAQGVARIQHKEIDGLTPSEIEGYFGSLMTSQELTQMNINAWGKYAQPDIIGEARTAYSGLIKEQLTDKQTELKTEEANSVASGLSDVLKNNAKQKAERLKAEIEDLKSTNVDKMNPESIAFALEKTNYLRGLTAMASTEWSTKIETDAGYYAEANLDLAKEGRDIERQKLELAKQKEARESKTAQDTSAFSTTSITKNTMQADLAETLSEEQQGAGGQLKTHSDGYNGIMNTAKEYLANTNDNDRKAFEKALDAVGLNSDLTWQEDAKNSGNVSKAATVFKVWESLGIANTSSVYGTEMLKARDMKVKAERDILKVDREAYTNKYKEDPDKYVDFLVSAQKEAENYSIFQGVRLGAGRGNSLLGMEKPINDESMKKAGLLSAKIGNFITNAGGSENLKKYLKDNPNKIVEFANLTDEADKTIKGIIPYNNGWGAGLKNPLRLDQNLKEDAKAEKERIIKAKTDSGAIMSSYNQYNFNEETNKAIIAATSQTAPMKQRGLTDTTKIDWQFDPKKQLSFHKEMEGKNPVIVATQAQGTGYIYQTYSPGDENYEKLTKLIDIEGNKATAIKAEKDTELEPSKVKVFDSKNKIVNVKRTEGAGKILANIYGNNNGKYFATKEGIEGVFGDIFETGFKLSKEEANAYVNKITSNVEKYTLKPITSTNFDETGYEFGMEVHKEGENSPTVELLGTDTMTADLKYLIRYYPEVLLLKNLQTELGSAKDIDEVKNIVNKF